MLAIVDTGPLVAFFDRTERHHGWAAQQLAQLEAPLLVCEPVLAEAMHLLARYPKAQDVLLDFVDRDVLSVALRVAEHVTALRTLLRKYRDIPMSLADACIVRMSEIYEDRMVFTLDSDFLIYRKHGRESLALIHPSLRH